MTREEFIEQHCRLCGTQRCYGEEYCAEYQEKVMGVPNKFREMFSNKPNTLPTNREWLASLTDKQLAQFLVYGLKVVSAHYLGDYPFHINLTCLASKYTQSELGIETWLSMPQDYIVAED